MALNETNVCNMVLSELGGTTITSLTDGTENAVRCNALYAPARDAVLEAHDWRFARKQADLTKLAETPEFEFDNVFQLPNDCIRALYTDISTGGWPWRVGPSVQAVWPSDAIKNWQVQGRKLYTDANTVKLLYTARITTPSDWSRLFVQAVVAYLGSKLAWPITRSVSVQDRWMALFERTLDEAAGADAQVGDDEGWVREDITGERY